MIVSITNITETTIGSADKAARDNIKIVFRMPNVIVQIDKPEKTVTMCSKNLTSVIDVIRSIKPPISEAMFELYSAL